MSDKYRYIILKVPNKCMYLSETDSGYYCSACIHCDGWEKIEKEDCAKCTHEKAKPEGYTYGELVDKIAAELYDNFLRHIPSASAMQAENMAHYVLKSLLER